MMHCGIPSPISKLPTEILSGILTRVRNDSKSGEFLSCLQCCRYWNDLALPFLYRDVVLYNANISLFTAALTHRKATSIRSLTLRVDLPWRYIQDLVPYIRDLTSLATFSVRITCSGEYTGPQDPAVRGMDINGLLQAIPASCRSVELDTEGYDRSVSASDGHVCETLQKLLPQLHHLRLRAQRVCPVMFGEERIGSETIDLSQSDISRQAPHLQTVLVNTIILPQTEGADLCYTYAQARFLKAYHAMITSARRLFGSGALPAIQKFSFIDNVKPKDRTRFGLFGHQATFNKYDIISNEGYVQFVEPILRDFKRYRLQPRNDEVVFGSLQAIGDVIEGVSWLETSNGSRFPSSFALTQGAIDAGYKWNRPVVENAVNMEMRDPKMWTYEQRRCS